MESAQRFGLRAWEAFLCGNALMAALRTGEWEWALTVAPEVMRDDPVTATNGEVDSYAAIITALRGEGDRLASNLAAMVPITASTSDPQYAAIMSMLRTWQAFTSGDLEATSSEGVPMEVEDPTYSSTAYSLAGHSALWLRDVDRARDAEKALNGLTVRGQWVDACRRSLAAGIAALEGNSHEALTGFTEAARMFRDHGMPFDTALCLMDEVATLGTDQPAGRAAADEAREILQNLGASVLLDQLDRLSASSESAPSDLEVPAFTQL